MSHFFDGQGIKRSWDDVRAVDHLFKLKNNSASNPWPVVEECLKIWEKKKPNEWQSLLVELQETRDTRRDSKFASSKPDAVHGGVLRYTVDFPEQVMLMIRCVYDPTELPMDREFFIEFAKRFPRFKVAEKL